MQGIGLIPKQGVVSSISTSSIKALDSCPAGMRRKAYSISNNSATQTITLGLGVDAIAGSGLVLGTGIAYWESDGEAFECFQGKINVISSASGGSVSVFERLTSNEDG